MTWDAINWKLGTVKKMSKKIPSELMKVTGHKTSRMVSRYYHPRAEDLAKKLD